MRPWAAALACVLTLSGCASRPAGVDGDLTNGWPSMPVPRQFRPEAGTCHAAISDSGAAGDYEPAPCSGSHAAETVAVTDLAGGPGLSTAAAALPRAYAECSRRTTAFLGADWRTGWVITQPVLPGKGAWSGGARWVRCDVAETSPADGSVVRRTGSLKGALTGAGRLRMACVDPTIESEQVTAMRPVDCAREHTAEFAGLFTTGHTSSADLTTGELEKGCDATIARFAGVPDDASVANRVGWLGFPPDTTAWKLGDRAIRCFLWLNGDPMTGSYRGAGPGRLPIQYER